MSFRPLFGQITILSLSFVTFRVSRFYISHLTHKTVKLCLQNTLNMSKTTRVYFGVLQDLGLKATILTMPPPPPPLFFFVFIGGLCSSSRRKILCFRTNCRLLMRICSNAFLARAVPMVHSMRLLNPPPPPPPPPPIYMGVNL